MTRAVTMRFSIAAFLGIALVDFHACFAGCQLTPLGELPVTMSGLRPTVHAKINGTDAVFVLDDGWAYHQLTRAAVAQYKLDVKPGYITSSLDPRIPISKPVPVSVVKSFTILNTEIRFLDFLVGEVALPNRTAGLLGRSILGTADVEYDLANGVIRLMRPKDCKDLPLAYWSGTTSKPYGVIDIQPAYPTDPIMGVVYVNGNKMTAIFESGNAHSFLTLEAAKRAGVTPNSAGVVSAITWTWDGASVRNWIGPIASFKIDDEEIRNTRMYISESKLTNWADLLLGADFFLAHRVYLANSQRRLYFTYNGGAVFNVAATGSTAPIQ
jgi:gag-polyprotein putative aspartyl protease